MRSSPRPGPAARSRERPRYLKEQACLRFGPCWPTRRAARCIEFVRNGELKATGKGSITEGIGIGRVTDNFKDAPVDRRVHVEDPDTVAMVYRLLREEGLLRRQHQRHQRRRGRAAWHASSGRATPS